MRDRILYQLTHCAHLLIDLVNDAKANLIQLGISPSAKLFLVPVDVDFEKIDEHLYCLAHSQVLLLHLIALLELIEVELDVSSGPVPLLQLGLLGGEEFILRLH